VICILGAELNCGEDKDTISCFDGEGLDESIKLVVISSLGTELACSEGDDGILCFEDKDRDKFPIVDSTFNAEVMRGYTGDKICCLDGKLAEDSK